MQARRIGFALLMGWALGGLPLRPQAQLFRFPTANHALLQPDAPELFYVGTVGRPWTSGSFGCVRTEGHQMHEGIDIKSILKDKNGEPLDPILATADGTVAYLNPHAGLSNYGQYIVLAHRIEGLPVYSLYAHLSRIQTGLKEGDPVKAGEPIGTMGRTSNTRQRISKDRAHLHFEINLRLNERFPEWQQDRTPGAHNDHGHWNGQNLAGLDPAEILIAQVVEGAEFSLLRHIRNQKELCRVLVRESSFPWLKRHLPLVRRNRLAEQEGAAAYEIALNFNGVPFELIPRAPSELSGLDRVQLLSVNEEEAHRNHCRRWVVQQNGQWQLGKAGLRLIDLLTYGH